VLTSDIIIITGGVSAGDADLVPQALAACGVQEIFHKVKIRPGKPIWFGRHPGGARVFALPGNPFSVQAACRLFIEPYLRACFDLPAAEPLVLPMGRAKMKRVSFDEFFPAKISNLRGAHIELLHHHSSGDITAVLDADGIAHHPAGAGDLMDGEFVDLYLWKNIR
jgi:molybdopterin molybdotransferase